MLINVYFQNIVYHNVADIFRNKKQSVTFLFTYIHLALRN